MGAPEGVEGPVVSRDHNPLIVIKNGLLMRITGCTCGWLVQAHEQNSDTAYAEHMALSWIAETSKDDQR